MKRVHLPAYSPVLSQRAFIALHAARQREKRIEAAARHPWLSDRDLGAVVLSLPRDLRPRSE